LNADLDALGSLFAVEFDFTVGFAELHGIVQEIVEDLFHLLSIQWCGWLAFAGIGEFEGALLHERLVLIDDAFEIAIEVSGLEVDVGFLVAFEIEELFAEGFELQERDFHGLHIFQGLLIVIVGKEGVFELHHGDGEWCAKFMRSGGDEFGLLIDRGLDGFIVSTEVVGFFGNELADEIIFFFESAFEQDIEKADGDEFFAAVEFVEFFVGPAFLVRFVADEEQPDEAGVEVEREGNGGLLLFQKLQAVRVEALETDFITDEERELLFFDAIDAGITAHSGNVLLESGVVNEEKPELLALEIDNEGLLEFLHQFAKTAGVHEASIELVERVFKASQMGSDQWWEEVMEGEEGSESEDRSDSWVDECGAQEGHSDEGPEKDAEAEDVQGETGQVEEAVALDGIKSRDQKEEGEEWCFCLEDDDVKDWEDGIGTDSGQKEG